MVALSWLLVGDRDIEEVAASGPVSGGMLRTLRAAVEGDVDLALRLIATDESALSGEPDPFVPGYEHSPVVQAYRAVVEVLLLVWRGDIGVARDRLIQAALSLPIAMPFAGLGVVLARRLDLAVLGELGSFARSLTVALPGERRSTSSWTAASSHSSPARSTMPPPRFGCGPISVGRRPRWRYRVWTSWPSSLPVAPRRRRPSSLRRSRSPSACGSVSRRQAMGGGVPKAMRSATSHAR